MLQEDDLAHAVGAWNSVYVEDVAVLGGDGVALERISPELDQLADVVEEGEGGGGGQTGGGEEGGRDQQGDQDSRGHFRGFD